MALNYDVSLTNAYQKTNDEEWEERQYSMYLQAITFGMMAAGKNILTKHTAPELLFRWEMLQLLEDGGNIIEFSKDKEPTYRWPTAEELVPFYGLTTNVTPERFDKWWEKLGTRMSIEWRRNN